MIKTFQNCFWSSSPLSCLPPVAVTPVKEAFCFCVICIFNYGKSEVCEIGLNEFLFHHSIKMSLSRLRASWNYCNPGELLLMRGICNSRYLTEEEDSHLEKIKIKKRKSTSEVLRNPSWKPPLSSSSATQDLNWFSFWLSSVWNIFQGVLKCWCIFIIVS